MVISYTNCVVDMLKQAIAPVLVGCGILLLSPHIGLGIQQYMFIKFGLPMVLGITVLIYTAFHIEKLWSKSEYRLVKQFIYLMTISIVMCTTIVLLTAKLFPLNVVA